MERYLEIFALLLVVALSNASLLLFWNDGSLFFSIREDINHFLEVTSGRPDPVDVTADDVLPFSPTAISENNSAPPTAQTWSSWFVVKGAELLICPLCQSYWVSGISLLVAAQVNGYPWWGLLGFLLPIQIVSFWIYKRI